MKKTLTLVTLLAASASQAAGIAIDTQGGRATGMGSTGVASARDGSSLYYNPAGMLGVSQLDVELGASLIPVNLSFQQEGGPKQTQTPFSPPPHAYFVYRLDEKLAAGVGVFTPYGANSRWPDDFVGRQFALESRVATYDINPTVAYAPMPWLRLGGGVQAVYGSVDVTRVINFIVSEGSVNLKGGDWGFGFNAGVQADVMPGLLTLGAHYRSWVRLGLEGDADFRDVPGPATGLFQDQPFHSSLRLPASLSLGAAFTPLPKLLLALDVQWVEWSSLKQLLFELPDPPPGGNQPSVKNWEDRWNVHVGAEYGLTDALAVRAGLVYDPTPSPEETLAPDLPDANRLKLSLGAGYTYASFRVDAGYQLVLLREQRSTFEPLPGTYSGTAHVIGLTLGYSR
jgi:long-chain fatty acid transport protein